ncbi:MAG: DUF1737 domain-containing protein [Alphaproteobacteria bacterium]|nr:DUF1737 domain-containing protein [Alphaproteobacteria bacterium]
MDYIILDDFEVNILQKKVNTYIKKGYRPVGGVAVASQKDGFVDYIQGMIRDADTTTPTE